MNIAHFKELTHALSSVRWFEKKEIGNSWDIASKIKKGNVIEFHGKTSRERELGACVVIGVNKYWSATKKGRKKDYHWYEYVLLSSNYPGERFYLEAEFDDEMILTLSEKMPKSIKVRALREHNEKISINDHDYYMDEKEWVIMKDESGKETHFFVEGFVLDGDDSKGISVEYWDDGEEFMFTESVDGYQLIVYF